MVEMQFKTNLQCEHCVSSIRTPLEQIPEVISWRVDLEHADKLLKVKAEKAVAREILRAVQDAGYTGQVVVNA